MYGNFVRHTDGRSQREANRAGRGAVWAEGLGKRFGDVWAVRELDLDVPQGRVLGLLGHNGAGKSTVVHILTTLLRPSAGRAEVAGYDIVSAAGGVRRHIGVAAQHATVDGLMSAALNLQLIGQLYGLSRDQARRRGRELLESFSLADAGDRLVKTFSGGMRRRLDLAASLVADPPVLFLDEPTTGLDPHAREELWRMLRERVADGMTLFLTTQYLEEADRLAHDVIVLHHGRTVAHGTPADLKAQVGGDRVEVTVPAATDLPAAAAVLEGFGTGEPMVDEGARSLSMPIPPGVRVPAVVRSLDDAGLDVLDVNRRQATLDDVFLTLTVPTGSIPPNADAEPDGDGDTP